LNGFKGERKNILCFIKETLFERIYFNIKHAINFIKILENDDSELKEEERKKYHNNNPCFDPNDQNSFNRKAKRAKGALETNSKGKNV